MESIAYEYVITVARHLNISKAAQELCITQPALTKFINRLEKKMGAKLFDRTTTPISITPAGKKFIENARQILDIEHKMQLELSSISSAASGTVTVGMNTEFCSQTLPYVLPEFRFRYPEIEFKIIEGNNPTLFQELEAGHADLVYASYSGATPNFNYDFIYNDSLLLAVPVEHPLVRNLNLANNSPITPYYLNPSRIKNCDFIVLVPEQGMGMMARNLFHKYHINPNIVVELPKNETALRLASTGMGMVFTPVRTPLRIGLIKPMAYFSIENPITTRSRGVYYSKYFPLSEAAKCFIQVFNDVFDREAIIRPPVCQLLFAPEIA